MKHLPLKNPSFRYLEESFKEWLDILGYAPTTIYGMPNLVRELLYSLEQQGINHIREMGTGHIESHYQTLKERTNKRRGAGLSNAHLNKHIQALRKFTEYLRKVGRLQLPALKLGNEQQQPRAAFLSEEEIGLLFKATHKKGERDPNIPATVLKAIRARDRAMLTVFYGCGLRRNEGACLDIPDINFERAILHVRKGKNYRERLVPINKASLKYLQDYVYDHRPELLKGSRTEALFISYNHCRRMQGQSLWVRLKVLQHRTEDVKLQEKEIGLHTLRHSIATHLLSAGMKLESISRFLGHGSLESTQIYTHLAGLGTEKQQPFSNIPIYVTEQEDDRQ